MGGKHMLSASFVLRSIDGAELAWPCRSGLRFRGVSIDSRTSAPRDLFVALGGARDGHDFIRNAVEAGVGGVLAARVVDGVPSGIADRSTLAYILVPDTLVALQRMAASWRQGFALPVVGVTGSVGKTTTKECIAHVLSGAFPVLRNKGNLNNEIGLPLTLLRLNNRHKAAVVEMGMYQLGEIASLCRIALPDVGVVTNVGLSHVERLGSIDAIAEAKSELIRALPSTGLAILNADDPRVAAMRDLAACRCVTFGMDPGADVRAIDFRTRGLKGISFTLETAGQSRVIESTLTGRQSVHALLAAASVGLHVGLDFDLVARRLGSMRQRTRLLVLRGQSGCTVIDDTYNASPASMSASLELLCGLKGRRVAVLGDMLELGAYEVSSHEEIGDRVVASADSLVAVGERSKSVAEVARQRGMADVTWYPSSDEAVVPTRKGDVVLVKGSRSMAMEKIVEKLVARRNGVQEPAGEESAS